MNNFEKNLTASNKEIKATRAKRVSQQAELAQDDIVRNLKREELELETKLENLEDLSPSSALSLNPIEGDFNAKEWCRKVQEIKIELLNKQIEYKVAKETYDKYFKEEKED